jgi:hypothetical protein
MIDRDSLLADCKALTSTLVEDLRERVDGDAATGEAVRGTFVRAQSAGRTDKVFEEWVEDLLAQVAAGWVLASVFVRFCEDNELVADALLSGPGRRMELARDRRAKFFAEEPAAGDREWLVEVFGRYRRIPAVAAIFGERNPLWQAMPSADGARAILEAWWARDGEGRDVRHDFTDTDLDTRFLGDLYQDLSEHARKQYALLQTPEFVERFILDRTLDPAIAEFGLDEVRMIDPTCGSGHFLLGAFERLFALWREREPATGARELAQRALDAVHGVDVNPFAVEIARFRLLVAAIRASGDRSLEGLPAYKLNVAVGDSLLHGTRPEALYSGAVEYGQTLEHHYPTEDAEEAERILQADTYHAVVGNPPYITVKDPALNRVYRELYSSCHRQYSLAVPFLERFFQLAVPGTSTRPAGSVGQITANSFMKREFGKKLIEEYLPRVDLTHVIDTSGAYIPGHGTPTVILLGRDRTPAGGTIRAVLGIRGEPGRPDDPANGLVWSSIRDLVDKPGAENDFISVDDVERERFAKHPWSLQGGAAPFLFASLKQHSIVLASVIHIVGYTGQTNADPVFLAGPGDHQRFGVEKAVARRFVTGDAIRDYLLSQGDETLFPYSLRPFKLLAVDERPGFYRRVWPVRTTLGNRQTFGKQAYFAEGRPWWEWHQIALSRVPGLALAYAFVATHNHFLLDHGNKVFNRHAPMIKLPEGAREDAHLELLGLLNSSAACFWMKQVFHNKGEGGGARVDAGYSAMGAEEWRNTFEFDSTKLKQFPLPAGRPLDLARALDTAAQRLAGNLPHAVAERETPTRDALDEAAEQATSIRRQMVALQEELDWRCYHLYGLTDGDLTCDGNDLPEIDKGERAFEIAFARRVAAGEATTTWFERHGSTPITEVPDHWPADYRALVQRRLDLIEEDKGIRLLERPEYKRRWYWEEIPALEQRTQRTWLLDRIEALAAHAADDPQVTTCSRLADGLARDPDAVAVAEDLAGTSVDLTALVSELVTSAGVPCLAAWRMTDSGLRKRAAWERTWALQRTEDALEARTKLPEDHPDHLTEAEHTVERKEAGVDKIPVPPKYAKADFRQTTTWTLRGKLDVPKERFVLYPGTRAGADTSPVLGWAGWDHLQQAKALATHYTARKDAGAEPDALVPLLAGLAELLPWVVQWHNEPDPAYGYRMGEFLEGFVATEAAALGVTREGLGDWQPPAPRRGRRKATT